MHRVTPTRGIAIVLLFVVPPRRAGLHERIVNASSSADLGLFLAHASRISRFADQSIDEGKEKQYVGLIVFKDAIRQPPEISKQTESLLPL